MTILLVGTGGVCVARRAGFEEKTVPTIRESGNLITAVLLRFWTTRCRIGPKKLSKTKDECVFKVTSVAHVNFNRSELPLEHIA